LSSIGPSPIPAEGNNYSPYAATYPQPVNGSTYDASSTVVNAPYPLPQDTRNFTPLSNGLPPVPNLQPQPSEIAGAGAPRNFTPFSNNPYPRPPTLNFQPQPSYQYPEAPPQNFTPLSNNPYYPFPAQTSPNTHLLNYQYQHPYSHPMPLQNIPLPYNHDKVIKHDRGYSVDQSRKKHRPGRSAGAEGNMGDRGST
jgi:hypothetical protein